jgi:hypothetical protein
VGDGLALEVVTERKVAEHLEERHVADRPPHVLDIRRAERLLRAGRARVRRRLLAEEEGLELHHPRGG